jgi:hypothetical protein
MSRLMLRTKLPLSLLLALPLSATAACNWNEVEDGRLGRLELTPSECGQPGCDLDDGIAVGGALSVSVRGKDGIDATGVRLVSSAPWIVDVIDGDDFGSEPSFRVVGEAAGLADLIAIDRYGYELDYLPVEVAAIADFDVTAIADGMTMSSAPGVGRVLEVTTGTEIELELDGTSRGRVLTGDVQLLAQLDAALAGAMLPGSDPARGELHFRAPSGSHDMAFTAPGGARMVVRVIGANALEPTR